MCKGCILHQTKADDLHTLLTFTKWFKVKCFEGIENNIIPE